MKTLTRKKQEDAAAAIDRVVLTCGTLAGKPQSECISLYLQKAAELPLWGAVFYVARWAATRRVIKDVIIAINEVGLHIFELDRKLCLRTIKFEDVASWGAKDASISFMSGNLIQPQNDTIFTEQAYDLAESFRAYQTAKAASVLQRKRTVGAGRRLRI